MDFSTGGSTMEREAFLKSRGIKTLRFWNSHLRRNAQSIRDTIFNELQSARATSVAGIHEPDEYRGKKSVETSDLTPALSSEEREEERSPSFWQDRVIGIAKWSSLKPSTDYTCLLRSSGRRSG